MEKKLLVLVDGSKRGMQTVNYVKEFMPRDEHVQVVLFHVHGGIPEEFRDAENDPECAFCLDRLKDEETEQKRKIMAYLERAAKKLVAAGFSKNQIEIKLQSLDQGIARDIIQEAKNGYSAVILRRRGMSAIKRIILGTVAVKLLQAVDFAPLVFVGETPPVKKVLLAVDGSPSSLKAATFLGKMLAGSKDHEICIFHAVRGLGRVQFEFGALHAKCDAGDLSDSCLEAFKQRTAKAFQNVRQILIDCGVSPERVTEKIVTGVISRSDAIVQEARDGGYSTIVVGRRGLSKVEAFFMGRVGQKVVYSGSKYTLWIV